MLEPQYSNHQKANIGRLRFDYTTLWGGQEELHFVYVHGGFTTYNAFGLSAADQDSTFFGGDLAGLKTEIQHTFGINSNDNSPFVQLFATKELAKAHVEHTKSGEGVLLAIKIAQLAESWVFKLSTLLEKFNLTMTGEATS